MNGFGIHRTSLINAQAVLALSIWNVCRPVFAAAANSPIMSRILSAPEEPCRTRVRALSTENLSLILLRFGGRTDGPRAAQSLSDSEFKLHWNFVHIGPFRQIDRPVLKHDAPVVIHDKANGGFCDVTSFSLPDNFHSYALSKTHKRYDGRRERHVKCSGHLQPDWAMRGVGGQIRSVPPASPVFSPPCKPAETSACLSSNPPEPTLLLLQGFSAVLTGGRVFTDIAHLANNLVFSSPTSVGLFRN
jgi:hypothetical protein